MTKKSGRIIAGFSSLAMLFAALNVPGNYPKQTVNAADDGVIYATDFESEDALDYFSRRGEKEVLSISDKYAKSGSSSLCVSEREESWNGAQFRIDDKCEPGTTYYISGSARGEWYTTVTMSYQYDDSEGETHYNNLKSGQGEGWQDFKEIKFSYTEDMKNVYVYFESSDAGSSLFVDDFEVKEAPVIPIEDDLKSISECYSPYFKIGTAILTNNLSSKSFMDLVQKHFGDSMTFGNELKPEAVLNKAACLEMAADGNDTNPQVSLGQARSLLNYCRDHNVPVRGHTLVWYSQTPDWFFKEDYKDDGAFVSPEKMTLRMENYIKNVMATLAKEYPTVEFYSWDVANEAFLDDGSPRQPGKYTDYNGSSGWISVYGDNSFLELAFTYARKYAPKGCKLYYNDYNEYIQGKTEAMVKLAKDFKEKGIIDGLGMQAHLDTGFPTVQQFEYALKAFSETGLDVQITELDITTKDHSESGFKKQASMYKGIMDAAVKYSDSVSAVVFWGVTDDESWRAEDLPLLFDGNFKAKPAYYSIVEGLEAIPREPREPYNPPEQQTTEETDTSTADTTAVVSEDIIYGDINGDGVADLTDLTLLSVYLMSKKGISADRMANADVDGNGSVDISDLPRFKQYISKDANVKSLGPVK